MTVKTRAAILASFTVAPQVEISGIIIKCPSIKEATIYPKIKSKNTEKTVTIKNFNKKIKYPSTLINTLFITSLFIRFYI
tara:strand:- start:34038 stop:34277 length:240 start_codon:yes stop_codon:yes gene_type:complete